MPNHAAPRKPCRFVACLAILAGAHATVAAQDGLALERTDVLSPTGTLTEPNEGFSIAVDLDPFAGERLAGGGFVILLEPPRPAGDALFGDSFEIQ